MNDSSIEGRGFALQPHRAAASFQPWTIVEAAVIRGQNILFGQHTTGGIHRLYANADRTMLQDAHNAAAGVTLTALADHSPIAIMRKNPDSPWRQTVLWQHRKDQSLIECQFTSDWSYEGTSRPAVESVDALELAYPVDISRAGEVG